MSKYLVTICESVYRTFEIDTDEIESNEEPTVGDNVGLLNDASVQLGELARDMNMNNPDSRVNEESYFEDYLDIQEVEDG